MCFSVSRRRQPSISFKNLTKMKLVVKTQLRSNFAERNRRIRKVFDRSRDLHILRIRRNRFTGNRASATAAGSLRPSRGVQRSFGDKRLARFPGDRQDQYREQRTLRKSLQALHHALREDQGHHGRGRTDANRRIKTARTINSHV